MLRISLAIVSIGICGANLFGADKSSANDGPSQEEVFDAKKVWDIQLTFTPDQWEAMEPKQEQQQRSRDRSGGFLVGPDGERNGIASAFGWKFPQVHADLQFGPYSLKDVAVRYKGNGTFLSSQDSLKKSLKFDFNDFVKGQKLAGMSQLNLHNSVRCRHFWYRRSRLFDVGVRAGLGQKSGCAGQPLWSRVVPDFRRESAVCAIRPERRVTTSGPGFRDGQDRMAG